MTTDDDVRTTAGDYRGAADRDTTTRTNPRMIAA
jgi:hypothetical protein